MTQRIKIKPIEQISPNIRVHHVDELGWPAKEHLAKCEEGKPVDVDKRVIEAFKCCDIVKYTDYYEVSLC